MEEILKQLLEGQKQLFEGQKQLITEVSSINQRLNSLETKVDNIEGQQNENSEILRALLHRTEEIDAKMDGLAINTASKEALTGLASKEDIADINDHLKALNERLFHQEAAISHLKAVK